MQLPGLADPSYSIDSPPSRPEVLLILATDEAFEVDAPDNVARLHEIQGGEWNRDCCGPAFLCNPGLGNPDSIPSRIAISVRVNLLLGNQGIALGAQRVHLENI